MDDENIQLALRHWINQCPKCRDRDAHQQCKPKLGEFPSSEQIKREQLDSEYNSASVAQSLAADSASSSSSGD